MKFEKKFGFKIDKRTLRSILMDLQEMKLVRIVDFQVQLSKAGGRSAGRNGNGTGVKVEGEGAKSSFFTRTIVTYKDVSSTDPRIEENPALVNPTFRRDQVLPVTIKENPAFIKVLAKPYATPQGKRKRR